MKNEKLRIKKLQSISRFIISFSILHSPFFILILATWLRLAYLPTLPPGLNFDEAGDGPAALDILHGQPRIWWPLGGGHEPLWPYLMALSTFFLGTHPLTLRLPAAWVGILTIAAIYPCMRQLFPQNRSITLLTMFLLACSEWHLHFSRLSFRAILLPLFATLAMTYFWRSLRQPRYTRHVALYLALAIYSYLAARLLPLVLLFFTIITWAIQPRPTDSPIRPLAYSLIRIFAWLALFISPLALHFFWYPADFTARAGTVSIFNPTWNHGDLLGTLRQTTALTLGTFFGLTGDANPLVNLPHQPAIPMWLAPFFLIGLIISLYQIAIDKWINRPFAISPSPHHLLLTWWLTMLFPAILAPEGAPHHLRLMGTIIPTYALIALGLHTTLSYISCHFPNSHFLLLTSYFLLLTPYSLLPHYHYFTLWPQSTDFTLPYDIYAVQLAETIHQNPPQVATIIPMDIRAAEEARHYTLDYLLGTTYSQPPNLTLNPNASYMYLSVDEHNAEMGLTQAAQTHSQFRLIRWTADKHQAADEKEIVTYLLTTQATKLGHETFPVYDIETWQPHTTTFKLPAINQPIGANFDNLLRIDATSIATTSIDSAWLPVAITFAPLNHMDADYKASLRLIAPNGERVAQKDRTLRHNYHQGTSLWPPETVNEYYLIPLPPNLPSAQYIVTILLYHPETQAPLVANGLVEVPLGQVRLP